VSISTTSLAHIALPLTLHSVNIKLARNASQFVMEKAELDLIFEVIRLFGSRYDKTGYLVQAVIKSLRQFCSKFPELLEIRKFIGIEDNAGNGSSMNMSFTPADDWSEALVQGPESYLRLTTYLDFTISRGRLPNDKELLACLPGRLRNADDGTKTGWKQCGGNGHSEVGGSAADLLSLSYYIGDRGMDHDPMVSSNDWDLEYDATNMGEIF
jgi:hypothetical protein